MDGTTATAASTHPSEGDSASMDQASMHKSTHILGCVDVVDVSRYCREVKKSEKAIEAM